MTAVLFAWLRAFAFTQAVEVPIYARALRSVDASWGCRRWLRRAVVGFGASALTHPVVWFVFPALGLSYVTTVAGAEAFAIGVEAGYLRAWGKRRALAWSLLANGASCTLALLSRWLFGAP